MAERRPILIAGPTASGKSRVALRLAERLRGIVINADSMQVYRDLRILTARPTAAEEARAPHALYGFIDGADRYSAGRFATDAARTLREAHALGLRPIIVGGTGLYFKALLEGLSPMPDIDESVRAHWRAEAVEVGADRLHEVLSARDPEMASRLASGDTQRIVRALEVLESTGRSLAEWQRLPREPLLAADDAVRIVIAPGREELAGGIDARFEAMLGQGALDEVDMLAKRKLDASLPIMGALGVEPLLRHRAGELDLAEATRRAQAETRQYAKRQLTWLRGNMLSWTWLSEKDQESYEARIIAFIDP